MTRGAVHLAQRGRLVGEELQSLLAHDQIEHVVGDLQGVGRTSTQSIGAPSVGRAALAAISSIAGQVGAAT